MELRKLLDTSAEEAVGHIPQYRGVFFSGESRSLNNVGFKSLWLPNQNYIQPTTPQNSQIVSDDVNDTLLGTGAQSMLLTVLDENFEEFFVSIDLNGTTPVALPFPICALNGAVVLSHGGDGFNDGNIQIVSTDDPTILFGQVNQFESNLRQAIQTVPAGETWIAAGFFGSTSAADSVMLRATAFDQTGLQIVVTRNYVGGGSYPFANFVGIPFPERFTFEVDGMALSGGANKDASVILQFRAYKNEFI